MCGIAGIYLKKPVKHLQLDKIVDELIKGIDNRGGDATGLASFGDAGLLNFEKATCDGFKFVLGRNNLDPRSKIVMVHTRLATQGHQAFPKNNHPVVNGDIFVTHNGHIANDSELWHAIGWQYRAADVDSEVIAGLVRSVGWENYPNALEQLEGSMAIAMVNSQMPHELVLAKGEYSPLVILENDSIMIWASTIEAARRGWAAGIGTPPKGYRTLKEGEIVRVSEGVSFNEKFEVKWDMKWYKYAQQTSGKACSTDNTITVVTSKGVTKRVMDREGATFKNRVSRHDLQAWGWDDDEIETWIEDLKADHDAERAAADAILNSDPGWWGDPDTLNRFNEHWDRIREIKDELDDLSWARTFAAEHEEEDEDGDDPKELDEADLLIQCPSCLEAFPLADMTGGDELYCSDCWGFWLESTGQDAPRAVMLDVNGDEIKDF